MSTSAPLFGFAIATLLVAAAALTAFGMRQRRYAGWRWWVVAMWLTAAGAAAGLSLRGTQGAGLSALLLAQWPVLALIGLRRFHPRQTWPGSERQDGALLLLASLLMLGTTAAGAAAHGLLVGAGAAIQLYVAALLFIGPAGREFRPVRGLGAAMALAALVPALAALAGTELAASLALRAGAAAMGALALAFVAITLVCERTERQLRDSRRRLRVLARLDALTQVPDHRNFQELANHALQHDEPATAVLAAFEIDHFRQLNELFGHAAGDRALALVGSALLESLRPHDVPGRQGSGTFALLLRRTGTHDAIGVAERIVAEVQRRAPQQQLPTLSLSFGLVQIGFGEGIAAAMRRAEQAMYEAKRQGRSRAVTAAGDADRPVFSPSRLLGMTPA